MSVCTFQNHSLLVLAWLAIMIPLILIRDITKFNIWIIISDVILVGLIVCLDVNAFIEIHENQSLGPDMQAFIPSTCLMLVGMALYAFEGVVLIIPIGDLTEKKEKYPLAINISMIITTFIYVTTGLIPYLAYGSETLALATLHLSKTSIFMQTMQLLYVATIIPTFILFTYPVVRIFERIIGHQRHEVAYKNCLRISIVLFTSGMAYGFADHWDKVMSLLGALLGSLLGFFFPPLFHWKLIAKTTFQKAVDATLIFFSVLIFFASNYITILYWNA